MVEEVGPFHVATDPTHDDYLGSDPQKMRRLRELAPFYTETELRAFTPFLNETDADLSLRDLDHLVTHMAADVPMTWQHGDAIVALHHTYRTWLETWKRRLFDCFRRFARVYFRLDGTWYATTPAQLNFFYFARTHGVIDYARDHAAAIHAHRRSWKRKPSSPRVEEGFRMFSQDCTVRF